MRAPLNGLALGLLALVPVACGPQTGGPVEPSSEALTQGSSSNSQAPGAAATSSLIALMVDAPFKVEFQGQRRYEIHSSDPNTPAVVAYRELVSSDGQGEYSIEPLDLIEPQLSPPDEAQFLLLQDLREGLFFRYRDLLVRHQGQFLANYVTVDNGQVVQVAGRDCAELQIHESGPHDCKYVLHVELTTGLVLRARETLMDGTLISLSEFESLDLAPDLSGVSFHVPLNDEVELDPDSSVSLGNLGFSPRPPKTIPAGWTLVEFAKVVDPTDDRPWAKYVYTDGLELMFLVQAQVDPTHQLNGAPPGPPYGTETMRSLTIGGMTALSGRIQGREMVALGKVDRQVLADLIQSTL